MKVHDSLSADSNADLLAMGRMLERTTGFVLGFVSINHRALSDALIDEYVADSAGKILVATLDAAAGESIVHQIGRYLDEYGAGRPLAIFVRGLEDMLELAGTRLQYIEDLNYSRSYCSQRFPFPLVFWVPEYVTHEFSQRAPDLWSCRSDVYYVQGTVADTRATVASVREKVRELLKAPERVGEGRALSSLLRAVREEVVQAAEHGSAGKDDCDGIRADIEEQLADLAGYAGEMDERERHLLKTFDITRIRNDLKGSAHTGQRLGQITLEMSRYGDAEDHYQQALRWYLEIDDKRGQSECYHGLGLVNLMLARYEDAKWSFSTELSLSEDEGFAKGRADAYLCLGHVQRLLGHNENAGDLYRRAMEIYGESANDIGRGNCLEGLGDIAWTRSDYREAESLYSEALRIAQENLDKRGEAGRQEGLGHVALMLAHYHEANELYHEALRLYTAIWNRRGEANTLRALGEAARVLNNDSKAKEYFDQALSIYRDIGHRRGEADAIRAIGHIARVDKEYRGAAGGDEMAAGYYRDALKIYTDIGSRWGQAACAEGLGSIYLALENYAEAEKQYQHALELSRAIGNHKGESAALRGLGDTAWAVGRYAAAAKHYETSQGISSQIGDDAGEAAFVRDRGDAAWASGDYDLAADLYREALEKSMASGDRWGEADGNRKLGNIAWKAEDVYQVVHLYNKALLIYRQLGAKRLEAECLVVLGRLPVTGPDREFVYGDDPARDKEGYTADAIRILTTIKAMSRAAEVASDAELAQLIEGLYARHGRHVDRPEHRWL